MKKHAGSAGITLAELVVSVGIIGSLGFLLPLMVKLFNNMAYLQQKSLIQKEVKSVFWQLSHEIQNSPKVSVPPVNDPDCLMSNNFGNCLRVYTYDYDRYENFGKYEDPKIYQPFYPTSADLNFGKIMYEVVSETVHDWNGNGRIDTKPYLLKRTIWPTVWNSRPLVSSNTYFAGRILRTGTPPTFAPYSSTSEQLFKVTLKLKSSFDRATEPPRHFSALLTMDSIPVL